MLVVVDGLMMETQLTLDLLLRRAETLFPLRGPSCSACDTAIPTQRRAVMAASGTIEMCEGCGALLYAGE